MGKTPAFWYYRAMRESQMTAPKIVIDRRPMWIVVFDRMRRGIFLALIFLLFFVALGMEGPADLSPEAYRVLCLFGLCVTLWSTNLIPLSATSLLAIGMVPLLGIMESGQVYAFFGNKAVFFILGAFILSGAMIACGLSVRLSMWVMENFGQSPRRLWGSIYLFGAISSCFMSEHAVAAMLFPIVSEIVKTLELTPGRSVFAKGLYFAMAWGCIIGGAATVLGGGRVPLAVEILEKTTDKAETLGIWQYTALSLPLIVLMLPAGWLVLTTLFKPEIADVSPALKVLHKKREALGKVSFFEMGVGGVMLVTLFFWFVFGERYGIANIAIIAIVSLFLFRLITWEKVQEHVNWAVILMYGGAICLGEVMADSGAALWLARQVFSGMVEIPAMFLITVAVLSAVFTTVMNNSAVIAVLLPPVLSLCGDYGISPLVAAMTVILPSNFAFILPIATPASALAYSSRCITLREMMITGSLLAGVGFVCYLFLLKIYWPLIGLTG